MTLVSNFTGADENPLSEGGNWGNLDSAGSPLQRISSAASGGAVANCRSYWVPANFGPDVDVAVTISTLSGNSVGLLARIQGEGGAATYDGYQIDATTAGCSIYRATDAGLLFLLGQSLIGFVSGDKLGMRCVGSTIQVWRQPSGSPNWYLLLAVVDATYASAGKIGVLVGGTTNRVDNLNAADYNPPRQSLFDPEYLYWNRTKARRGRRFPTLAK